MIQAIVVLSEKTAEHMIRTWRRARLAAGESVLGYPRTNVLHPTHGVGTAKRIPELGMTDVDKVQRAVDAMHAGMRSVFEVWELGLIGGVNYRDKSQRKRARLLGIAWDTYRYRYDCAFRFVQRHVSP